MKRYLSLLLCLLATLLAAPALAGDAAPRRATGFYRAEADGETWWLVDPKGQPTLSIGTDHVRYEGHWCETLGYSPYGRNMVRRYGSADAWACEATRRLLTWNFNVLGAGHSPETRHRGLAHTEFLSFGSDFSTTAALVPKTAWTGWPDVFDPRFAEFCEKRARQRCDPQRDDPCLLGYFLDNELEWFGKRWRPWGIALDTCSLPATAAGKKALVESLRRTFHGDVAAVNAAFQTKLEKFDDLSALRELPEPRTDRAKEALAAFVAEAAGRYFDITTAAVRRHDRNHMILGCRFAHDVPEAAWRAAGRTCDVVTVNIYPRIDLWHERTVGVAEHLASRFALCRRPLIVTEWSFPALDAKDTDGRPLPCRHGAGMRVDSQQQRACCYAIMQRELLAMPFVVGSHWFMWNDEPSRGICRTFPEDSNYGLVSETDEVYTLLTATATRVNAQLMPLHAGKIRPADVSAGQWRPLTPQAAAPLVPGRLQFQRTTAGYTIDTGAMRLVKDQPDGMIFNRVSFRTGAKADWIELGSYEAVLHVANEQGDGWPHADRVLDVRVCEESPQRLTLEIECGGQTLVKWRAAYRLKFETGRSWFRARCLWVENEHPAAWRLSHYFHYLPSRIGGKAEDDEPVPSEMNYWLGVAAWRDPALGVHYGVMPPRGDSRVECRFWKDKAFFMQHPDCRRAIDRELRPGQRWIADADEPDVVIFGLRETPDNLRPWMALIGQTE